MAFVRRFHIIYCFVSLIIMQLAWRFHFWIINHDFPSFISRLLFSLFSSFHDVFFLCFARASWWCLVNKLQKMILNAHNKGDLRNNLSLPLNLDFAYIRSTRRRQWGWTSNEIKSLRLMAWVCLLLCAFASFFGMKRETGYFDVYRFAQRATIIISSNHDLAERCCEKRFRKGCFGASEDLRLASTFVGWNKFGFLWKTLSWTFIIDGKNR